MRNIKNQKGAISLFVVLAMLFFLAFMLGVFSMTNRRNAAQLEAIRETAKIYASGIDANEEYDSMLATTSGTAVPITTLYQLQRAEALSKTTTQENYTINGKLYTYKKDANYYLANDIILDMKSEIDGKSNITIYDYILYNPTYKISLNNHNIFYRFTDGSLWKCVFYQDIGTVKTNQDNRFTNRDEAGKCYLPDKYSILSSGIEEFSHPWSSTDNYEFLLAYSCDSGKFIIATVPANPSAGTTEKPARYNRWRQTNSPAKESVSDASDPANTVATGYNGSASSFSGAYLGLSNSTDSTYTAHAHNYWGGLTLSTTGACYINGSVGHSNWFYAIGVYKNNWHSTNGIPCSSETGEAAREAILFVRVQ